jgi:hypothetical protein
MGIKEDGRTFGFAAEFPQKGTLIRRVAEGFAPRDEFLVVTGVEARRNPQDPKNVDVVRAVEIDNRGYEPVLTQEEHKIPGAQVVEVLGRFEVDPTS